MGETLMPPQNHEAEQHTLGACFAPEGLETVAELVNASDFYRDAHRLIFAAMLDLSERGIGLDTVTVSDELTDRGVLDAVGGRGYVADLEMVSAGWRHGVHYAGIVREMAARRALLDFREVITAAVDDQTRPATEAQDWLEGELLAIGQERGYKPMSNAAGADEADRMLQAGDTGMPMHVRSVSRFVTMNPGVFTLIGATRSTGKSRWAMGEIRHKCPQGIPVKFFSLEMTRAQVYGALYALELGIPFKDLRAGAPLGTKWNRWRDYRHAVERVKAWPLEIDDRGGLTVRQMAASARRFHRTYKGRGLIVIDYAQIVRGFGKTDTEKHASVATELAEMAKQLYMPVVLLSQVTETGKTNPLGVPDAHSRGSLEFEIKAETVIVLNRPGKRVKPDSLEAAMWEGKAQAHLCKNRFGTDEGVVNIGWREGVGCFCDLERDEPMQAPPEIEYAPPADDEEQDLGDPFAD